jgi:pilus assembly protein CpaE
MADTDGNPQKIRVLIVDDIPDTRESLRKLLYFEGDIEVVGAAGGGDEAVRQVKTLKPDIVLMDINMPGMDGITATEAITQQFPLAQVIMMSVQADSDYLRRSMLAGAREFLAKPFTADDLVNSIRRVHQLGLGRRASLEQVAGDTAEGRERAGRPAKTKGKLVTVFSPKGGTGRSTIAVNLAIALQGMADHKVALVDANLQFGDVAVLLNLQPSRSIADLIPQINELDTDLMSSVLTPHSSGIKALLAPVRPELADLVAPEHLKAVLRQLLTMCDYVIVDTWPSLQDCMLNILDMSDRVLLVTTPDIPAIKNARLFFEVTDALQYPEERTALLINIADKKGAISAKDVQASIKHPVAMRLPTDERSATQAANEGVPLVISQKKSVLAIAISELAAWLMAEFAPPLEQVEAAAEERPQPQAQQRVGLLGRIF